MAPVQNRDTVPDRSIVGMKRPSSLEQHLIIDLDAGSNGSVLGVQTGGF